MLEEIIGGVLRRVKKKNEGKETDIHKRLKRKGEW